MQIDQPAMTSSEQISFPDSIMGYSFSAGGGGRERAHSSDTEDSYNSSSSTFSSAASNYYDSDSSDESNSEIADRVEKFQSVGMTPRLAELVFATGLTPFADKRPTLKKGSSSASLASSRRQKTKNLLGEKESRRLKRSNDKLLQKTGLRRSASDQGLTGMHNAAKLLAFLDGENNTKLRKKMDLNAKKPMKPDDKLKRIAARHGYTYKTYSYEDVKDTFFVKLKPESYSGYDKTISTASRAGDLKTFQEYHAQGKPVQVCNKYGESVVHTVCRCGHTQLLNFLLNEAFVSVQISDDYGRNPMHDAAWTHKPNFGLARKLVLECPDLLYIKDTKGFTPMNYAGPSTWSAWCKFFDNNAELLQPRILG